MQRGHKLIQIESLEVPKSLTDDLWKKTGICTTDYCLPETVAPATRRNAFCDLLHLIKMSMDDVFLNCIFHASLHSGGKGSRKVQNTTPTSTRGSTGCPNQIYNFFLLNTSIFFLLTIVNLITALFVILHYISVV